jgi:1-acyl-sn-glycerol-3-phosphate acyltransferase
MKAKQRFAQKIIRWMGWKITGETENIQLWNDTQKCIIIEAPHTTFWDYVLGHFTLVAMGKKGAFLINKKFFFFPLNLILKAHGGIPVEIRTDKKFLQQVVELYEKADKMFLTITPEGTREKVIRWKRGFYNLVQATNAPLLIGALDYKKKHIILGNAFTITDNYNTDMKELMKFYENVTAKYPEKFALHVAP